MTVTIARVNRNGATNKIEMARELKKSQHGEILKSK